MDQDCDPYLNSWKEITSFGNSYAGYELISSVCAVIFTNLVLLDVWKAFRRKATWIPGQALVLSAPTVQLLLFIEHLNVSINSSNRSLKAFQLILLLRQQLLLDCRRVMMCVFIAYLLPGIVSRGFRSVWGNVGALALVVIGHMVYETYFLLTFDRWVVKQKDHYYRLWEKLEGYKGLLIPSYIVLSLAIIWLVVLLSCAVIAGKSIRNIMSQKVPLALSCCCNSTEYRSCKNIEDHVLKSWIVVRASQPDYIMARSVFSASAATVVTVCVVLLIVKWTYVPLPVYIFDRTVYGIQFSFVVVGSIVVVFRWLTAVFYFPKNVGCMFYFEDFWTRKILQQKDDLHGCRLLLSLLLTMLLWVQMLMVLLSKVCWCLSQFVFGMIRPFIMSNNKSDQISKYKEVLEIIRMPGEDADNLWRANESAFEKTENHFKKGIENGKSSSKELISLLEHKTGTPEPEAPTSLQEEKHFKEVSQNSWKMRAVSLIHFIMYFYDGTNSDVVNDCIEAYRQAFSFMDMVDRSDPEAKLVSKAADNEFNTLQNVWKKHRKMQSLENSNRNQLDEEKESNRLHNQQEARPNNQLDEEKESNRLHKQQEARPNNLIEQKIKKPLKENLQSAGGKEGQKNPCVDTLHDSKDWKRVAAKISLYKIGKVTDLDSNSDNAIHNLRCSLANVIFHCLEKEVLDRALKKNCNKWAEKGEEEEIFNAAFTAGKAKGVRQQIRERQDAGRVLVEDIEAQSSSTVHDQV